ncbi:hypothetical protein Sjap_025753 [Stephania japonica]|uniref:Uncharacterized protein n=1 Tax=Stephania japonica TaxID=461633 RepID=A0AAP0E5R9_9MAGN
MIVGANWAETSKGKEPMLAPSQARRRSVTTSELRTHSCPYINSLHRREDTKLLVFSFPEFQVLAIVVAQALTNLLSINSIVSPTSVHLITERQGRQSSCLLPLSTTNEQQGQHRYNSKFQSKRYQYYHITSKLDQKFGPEPDRTRFGSTKPNRPGSGPSSSRDENRADAITNGCALNTASEAKISGPVIPYSNDPADYPQSSRRLHYWVICCEDIGAILSLVLMFGSKTGSTRLKETLKGLSRCRKSCRLRWENNLRPDIKKMSYLL